MGDLPIVERLRTRAESSEDTAPDLFIDAADTIERLTRERDEAREAIQLQNKIIISGTNKAIAAGLRVDAAERAVDGWKDCAQKAAKDAEAAERKLAMAVEPLRAARKAILMLSPNPDGVLGMQALHAVKLIDAALAELEKDDGNNSDAL